MGVDWMSPAVLGLTQFLFSHTTIFVLGMYSWYFVLTLPAVEIPLVRRRTRVQLAHVPYLIGRYANLVSLFAVAVAANMPVSPLVVCSGIHVERLITVTGNIAMASASTNLALRAIALWAASASRPAIDASSLPWRIRWRPATVVVWALRALCLAHYTFGLALGTTAPKMAYVPILSPANALPTRSEEQGPPTMCMITTKDAQSALLAFYAFTLSFDLLTLTLTMLGLRMQGLPLPLASTIKRASSRTLSEIIFTQGVFYGFVTLATSVPMVVMSAVRTNDIMSIIFAIPGCTVSVMASSAVVASLFNAKMDAEYADETRPSPVIRISNASEPAANSNAEKQGQILSTVVNVTSEV